MKVDSATGVQGCWGLGTGDWGTGVGIFGLGFGGGDEGRRVGGQLARKQANVGCGPARRNLSPSSAASMTVGSNGVVFHLDFFLFLVDYDTRKWWVLDGRQEMQEHEVLW